MKTLNRSINVTCSEEEHIAFREKVDAEGKQYTEYKPDTEKVNHVETLVVDCLQAVAKDASISLIFTDRELDRFAQHIVIEMLNTMAVEVSKAVESKYMIDRLIMDITGRDPNTGEKLAKDDSEIN